MKIVKFGVMDARARYLLTAREILIIRAKELKSIIASAEKEYEIIQGKLIEEFIAAMDSQKTVNIES